MVCDLMGYWNLMNFVLNKYGKSFTNQSIIETCFVLYAKWRFG